MLTEIQIKKLFIDKYGTEPLIIKSPGRVNIIGEHTDYNNGFVLPGAMDKYAYIAIAPRDDNKISLTAYDMKDEYVTQLNNLKPITDKEKNWTNYILGVVDQLQKKNFELKGFNAILTSEVPIGAGVSSSAAIECATTFALNELFKIGLTPLDIVKISQKAEHTFAGVMCGIMDQFASVMGKADSVIKLDCQTLEYEYIPFKLNHIKILLLNTNVKHSLASSEYNLRRNECNKAVELIQKHNPNVKSLRDANVDMLNKYVPKNTITYNRALFVIQEIERLLQSCEYLKQGNIVEIGKKMFETHYGLSKLYEVSCKELDYLIEQVKNKKEVLGARMMGGGFGGCTINLVQEDKVASLVSTIKNNYEKDMGLKLDYYVASISDGTRIVK